MNTAEIKALLIKFVTDFRSDWREPEDYVNDHPEIVEQLAALSSQKQQTEGRAEVEKWISVEDRLPESGDLLWFREKARYQRIFIGQYGTVMDKPTFMSLEYGGHFPAENVACYMLLKEPAPPIKDKWLREVSGEGQKQEAEQGEGENYVDDVFKWSEGELSNEPPHPKDYVNVKRIKVDEWIKEASETYLWKNRAEHLESVTQALQQQINSLEEQLEKEKEINYADEQKWIELWASLTAKDKRIAELEQQLKEQASTDYQKGWISVEDRLPDTHSILAYSGGLKITLTYIDGNYFDHDGSRWCTLVTHWQPLPAPPATEQQSVNEVRNAKQNSPHDTGK